MVGGSASHQTLRQRASSVHGGHNNLFGWYAYICALARIEICVGGRGLMQLPALVDKN
jgi:hypothetical protein